MSVSSSCSPGEGLGLHEHAGDGNAHASEHLREAAEEGMLAGGAVVVVGQEPTAAELDGTITWPRRRHRPAEVGDLASRRRPAPTQRWWSARIHGHHRV